MTLLDLLNSTPLPKASTVEYVDDDPGKAYVVFKDEAGNPVAYMLSEDYWKMVKDEVYA
jgi:hypothetical protein